MNVFVKPKDQRELVRFGLARKRLLKTNEKMLSVPIDQRFSWDDIEDIADIICDVVNNV